MIETAERVADRYGVTREDMDEFAALSQNRAVAARDNGSFAREILPVPAGGGSIEHDDGPRPGTTVAKLAALRPILDGGRVTAGNACPMNDGAAAALVMSAERADALGLRPRARVLGSHVTGLAPEVMGLGPIEATRGLLQRTAMKITDVDVVELNEAFAAQVLPVCRELGIDVAGQLNPFGGAIALGHPYGMTGVRMLTTLLNGLEAQDGSVGLLTLCIGGGQGMAMLIERAA
jgi:acetyl-CoA C-acetyltransferase